MSWFEYKVKTEAIGTKGLKHAKKLFGNIYHFFLYFMPAGDAHLIEQFAQKLTT
jgi:hypothetical protein